jgi:hypothetical protein
MKNSINPIYSSLAMAAYRTGSHFVRVATSPFVVRFTSRTGKRKPGGGRRSCRLGLLFCRL